MLKRVTVTFLHGGYVLYQLKAIYLYYNAVMLHLAQVYWVTNSFDMNSFNVLFGK